MRISDWSSDVCSSDLEGRDGIIGERRMMAAREPLAFRQELVEVPAPARRVLARAMPLGLRRIENILDPAAQALGGFRRALPYALQYVEPILRRDCIDPLSPDRLPIFGEVHFPLLR